MKRKLTLVFFKALARLPLPVLYLFSDIITPVLYHLVKYRRDVVRANLTSSFPEKDIKEIKKIEREFYRFLGDQTMETLKLFHISDVQLKKRVRVINYEEVNDSTSRGHCVEFLMGHYCNWEWVQEIRRYFISDTFKASIYHPLSNKTWDDLFLQLRSRWGIHIVQMTKAPRVLMAKQNQPWICGFIADAWTWRKDRDNWVEFLNHKTWFIYGSEDIGKKTCADFFYLEMKRKKRGYYDIIFHKLEPSDTSVPYPYSREFWKKFEETIRKAPAYWLWSHKRWK